LILIYYEYYMPVLSELYVSTTDKYYM
jgi:hypothetical protein